MSPASQGSFSVDFCAGLGLIYKVFNGGVKGCVRYESSPHPEPVYCYKFSERYEQVNYNVVDYGNGRVICSSGWQPGPANGCPRDGFPW
jgi:hypothetical protein